MDFSHRSVLLGETVDSLNVRPDGVYIDGTTGGGGHSFEIASRLQGGKLYCFDKDEEALDAAKKRLSGFENITFIKSDFSNLDEYINEEIDGMVLDLGVSSYQLDNPERGFSYMNDAPLDMRMDVSSPLTAKEIVNGSKREELIRILRDYGEENFAPLIAGAICREREKAEIATTAQLSGIIKEAIPKKYSAHGHHPAKKSFQALRIAVNGELDVIRPAIMKAAERMKSGGRISVITFHSLEDRIVKNAFRDLCAGCECPPDFPVCVCGRKPLGRLINRKPVIPSEEELNENPRARSAKLRVFERNDETYSPRD